MQPILVETKDGRKPLHRLRLNQLQKIAHDRGIETRYPAEVDVGRGDLPKEVLVALISNAPYSPKTRPLGRAVTYADYDWAGIKTLCVQRGISLPNTATREDRIKALEDWDEANKIVLKE